VYCVRPARHRADDLTSRLALGLKARLTASHRRFSLAHIRIVQFDFRRKMVALRLSLQKCDHDLGVRVERTIRVKRDLWERLVLQLEERSPLKVLERGYAIATDAAGNVLRDTAQVAVGDEVKIQLHRGALSAEVNGKTD
jgi:exodeoxyribonuclease VII large subunit